MARFTGPKSKVSRRFNEPIFGDTKAVQKKPYGPGQHGRGRRKKQSEYAVQLMEKQKAKYTYGVLERQFSNLFKKAAAKGGVTGENLLQLLEARLDNVVYRLGISKTRRGARQLVAHKHITVNGEILNIPSYSLKAGDVVSVRDKAQTNVGILESVASTGVSKYSWLEFDSKDLTGKYISIPDRSEIPENIKEQLIVELYSK
jgi:small subunit ribosomal protein S4